MFRMDGRDWKRTMIDIFFYAINYNFTLKIKYFDYFKKLKYLKKIYELYSHLLKRYF